MNYLGDLSKQDYEVLKNLALNSKNILEFGISINAGYDIPDYLIL
jgi:hypothetical protein